MWWAALPLLAEAGEDKSGFLDWALKNSPLMHSTIGVGAFLLGALAGWFLKQFREFAEIRKLNQETEKLKGDIAKIADERDNLKAETRLNNEEAINKALERQKEIESRRKAYNDACDACTECCKDLARALQEDQDKPLLVAARERLCSSVASEVIPKFVDYVTVFAYAHDHDPQTLWPFIEEEVTPGVSSLATWIEVINHPKLLGRLLTNQLKISRATLHPLGAVIQRTSQKEQKPQAVAAFGKAVEYLLLA